MAETVVLEGKTRQERRRRQVDRLREQGFLPAILYGHGEEPECLTIPTEPLERAVRRGERIVELKTENGTSTALIQDLQFDFLGKEMLHVDFKRIDKDEKIHMALPVELRGTAPGAVSGGGVLEQPLHTLNVECLATNAPTSIEVNINELQLEEAIHVKDLQLPEGVLILDDPEAVIVHVVVPMEETEEEGEGEGQAEPELIGRPEEEGEGAEEQS